MYYGTSWLVSKAEHLSALVGVHSEQCCHVDILSFIEGFACVCMCMHLPKTWHMSACVWAGHVMYLQASTAVDVSAYNGWYLPAQRAELVSAFIGLHQGDEHEFAFSCFYGDLSVYLHWLVCTES